MQALRRMAAMPEVSLTHQARTPRFTDVFVRRPVLAAVISMALVVIGIRVALDMPVLQYPQIESASLEISPTASPPLFQHVKLLKSCQCFPIDY